MLRQLAIFFLGTWVSAGFASETTEKQIQALSQYQTGNFLEAAQLYESLLVPGQLNASVLFNLGNSYAQANKVGLATAAFLKAKDLLPRDPDIVANLNYVRQLAKDELQHQQPESWTDLLTFRDVLSDLELAWLITIMLTMASLTTSLVFWLDRHKTMLLRLGLSLFAAGLMVAIMFVSFRVSNHSDWGAVIKPELSVFASPSDKAGTVVFKLHEGAPVKLVDRQLDWVAIELYDQKRGWVRADQVKFYL